MALGTDATACTAAFVAALRARLDALTPPAGGNVDLPEVHANLAALGAAVHQVLTGPGQAETLAAPAHDATFWTWVSALAGQVAALTAWQGGVRTAAAAWVPADPGGAAVKAALLADPQPGPPPATPSSLTGVIR
jgi:hypothetical protein